MGSFVFNRLPEELEHVGQAAINPDYWSEKLEAVDRAGGYREYSAEKFHIVVHDHLADMARSESDVDMAEIRRTVADEVLSVADEGEEAVRRALQDAEHLGVEIFSDTWEWNFQEYTYRFIWCCYALVWGIAQYDAKKAGTHAHEEKLA
jgi:hypothetical protein